jgi:hypothetical protein
VCTGPCANGCAAYYVDTLVNALEASFMPNASSDAVGCTAACESVGVSVTWAASSGKCAPVKGRDECECGTWYEMCGCPGS